MGAKVMPRSNTKGFIPMEKTWNNLGKPRKTLTVKKVTIPDSRDKIKA